jgi:hypothetical protein
MDSQGGLDSSEDDRELYQEWQNCFRQLRNIVDGSSSLFSSLPPGPQNLSAI